MNRDVCEHFNPVNLPCEKCSVQKSTLREAAQAVLNRWDSPAWEWLKQGPTAALMADLRAALAEPQRKPLTLTDLQEALVYTNLIDRDAIEDPDGYDEGSTLAQIDELHRAIERAHGIGEKE